MRLATASTLIAAAAAAASFGTTPIAADDSSRLLTIDHYVRVRSAVPAIAGQDAYLYVRERVAAGVAARGGTGDKVALFVHGAGTPAEVSFDVPYKDYSWMAYLANAGFDVFSVDMSGYGRSVRPSPMNNPCNLSAESQRTFVPSLLPAPCPAPYPHQLTSMASDWADVGAAVDYIRALRRVERVNLLAWSLGGPRAGGYAAQNPAKVNRLVLLAPAYNRMTPAAAPASLPATGVAMNTQSHSEFVANWDRQVGCTDQYEQAASDSVWSEMMTSDPVGATWGSGVRRAPNTTNWGWGPAAVARMQTPTLMVAGVHDKQVNPERVRELYMDLGASQKVFIDLGCSSHNAMWERNHELLFRASLEWLEKGTVGGKQDGMQQMGYSGR